MYLQTRRQHDMNREAATEERGAKKNAARSFLAKGQHKRKQDPTYRIVLPGNGMS